MEIDTVLLLSKTKLKITKQNSRLEIGYFFIPQAHVTKCLFYLAVQSISVEKSLSTFHAGLSKHANTNFLLMEMHRSAPKLIATPKTAKNGEKIEKGKIIWEPVLCRHLRAHCHSAAANKASSS